MSFHKKALIAFVMFHIVFTGGGLLIGTLNPIEPTNDQEWIIAGVWRFALIAFLLTISVAAMALAYLIRAGFLLVNRQRAQAMK